MKITMYKCDGCGKEASGEQVKEGHWVSVVGLNGLAHLCGMSCATQRVEREMPRMVERVKEKWEREFRQAFEDGRHYTKDYGAFELPLGVSIANIGIGDD